MLSRFPIFFKVLMIALITLLISIALGMIEGKIKERANLQTDVQREIARSASGEQTLTGPYLVLEYKLKVRTKNKDSKGIESITETIEGPYAEIITPETLNINGKISVESRYRGIYKAMLYNLNGHLKGGFNVQNGYASNKLIADMIPTQSYLVMTVSDARGLQNNLQLNINGKTVDFEAGTHPANTGERITGNGFHAVIDTLNTTSPNKAVQTLDFSFPLDLQGMTTLGINPIAKNTDISLNSPWQHPSFGGAYLPKTRTINAQGFSANWFVSSLARNTQATQSVAASNCTDYSNCPVAAAQDVIQSFNNDALSIDFIEPVNIYQQAERAVKYGIMFIVLVFAAFFLFEMLLKLPIHPMQYLLVGLSMAMFFLLLISLSEHISFLNAYISAGISCVLLLGMYLTGLLKTRKAAWLFASGIALLYTLLYGVLQSEDNALVMGALVLFGGLATVMLLTRKLDWYNMNQQN